MKRFIKVVVMMVILATLFMCGCGENTAEAELQEEAPKIIHIYSFDEDISDKLEYVWQKHSDWKERVEIIVVSEDYVTTIDNLLTDKEVEKYPDLIVGDYKDVAHFVNSEETISVSELGLEEASFDNMYDYTKTFATDNDGNIKGVSWEITPGAFVYRRSLAAEYLGSDDEKNVQSYVKDWDTFIDTARALQKKTDGGVKMLASVHDIDKTFTGASWMNGEEAVVNSDFDKLLDVHYALNKNQFVVNADAEAESYMKAINLGNVFGYFADADVLKQMEENCTGDSKSDWAVCKGPQGYINGGVWMFVSKKCCDKEFAGEVVKALCTDEAILKNIFEENGTIVNNKRVVSNAYNSGKGKITLLGGGDYLQTFDKTASNYQANLGDEHDSDMENLYMSIASGYYKGNMTKEQITEEYLQKAEEILHPVVEEPQPEQE